MADQLNSSDSSLTPEQTKQQRSAQNSGGPVAVPPGFEDAIARVQQLEQQTLQDPSACAPLIQAYEQILARLQPEKAPLFYATIQFNMGKAYCDLPVGDPATNLARAIACYQEAWRFRTPETDPDEFARTQVKLGNTYRDLPTADHKEYEANLTSAIACYRHALRVWTPVEALEKYLFVQMLLGTAYHEVATQDNLLKAIACYQEVLRFETPEHDLNEYIRAQSLLGDVYRQLVSGSDLSYVEQEIACYREILRYWVPGAMEMDDYVATWVFLGVAFFKLQTGDRAENIQQAIACYQKALRYWTPEIRPQEYASIQTNLGNAYGKLPVGDPTANLLQAIACYEEALRYRTPEDTPEEYAATLVNLGATYADLPTGNSADTVEQAIACYQEALRYWTPENRPQAYAWLQASLGNAYSHLFTGNRADNLARALDCYQEALRFQTPEDTPDEYARTRNGMGTAYATLPGDEIYNLKQAISCYQDALQIWTSEKAPLEYARTQVNLGATYVDLAEVDTDILENVNNLVRAMTCYQEALRFQTPEIVPLEYAWTQAHLGYLCSKMTTGDRVARAIACYREALRFQTPESMPDQCRRTNIGLADFYFAEKEWKAALDAYRIAMAIGESLFHAGLSAESKAFSTIDSSALYQKAAFAAARCNKPAEALLILERGKTRLLTDSLRLRVPRPAGVPDETWNTFGRAAASVQAALSGQIVPTTDVKYNQAQLYAARQRATRDANADLNTAIAQVRQYAPGFLQELDLRAIQALLPDQHTVLVAFCITDSGSLGFVVSRSEEKGIQMIEVPNFTRTLLRRLFSEVNYTSVEVPDSVQLNTDADLYRLLLTGESTKGFAGGWMGAFQASLKGTKNSDNEWQNTITSTLADLGEHLLAPILSALPPEAQRIIFLPSAELFLFPLHAVPLSRNGLELVCDRYQVSYAPSVEVLADANLKAAPGGKPALYAVINPTTDLVFTSAEGNAIVQLFENPTIDEGQDGTKEHVIAGVQARNYVHFSCHGRYDWSDPPSSGLVLSDGSLTLAELQDGVLDLSAARLVTLSACETGITDVVEGSAQEYVGIPAGFLLAGVPCVVSSLWAVDDFSTALLMEEFYKRHLLEGQNVAKALQGAQRWLRNLSRDEVLARVKESRDKLRTKAQDDNHIAVASQQLAIRLEALQEELLEDYLPRDHPFVHPYYWAAFLTSGAI